MEPLTVDIREAGRLMSLSPYTIRAYIKSGRLASVRVGRRVLIEPCELEILIEKGRSQGRRPENSMSDPRKETELAAIHKDTSHRSMIAITPQCLRSNGGRKLSVGQSHRPKPP